MLKHMFWKEWKIGSVNEMMDNFTKIRTYKKIMDSLKLKNAVSEITDSLDDFNSRLDTRED